MSAQDQVDASQLAALYARFRAPEVDDLAAANLFGIPVTRTPRVWTLEPKADLAGIRSVNFLFDDVRPDKNLLDTVELAASKPWKISSRSLTAVFHAVPVLVPPGPSGNPKRSLAIRQAQTAGLLQASVRFDLELGSPVGPDDTLVVVTVVFRRFYPD